MSAITFDTFKFVERLEKAGLTREQSAAIVEAQKDAFAESLDSSLATKADIIEVKGRLDRIDNRLETLELRLVIKLGALFAVTVGILIAVMRLP